jgi:transglutaminase-like putative cysteine protease
MNHRLTVTAAIATALASISLYPLLSGTSWFWGGIGAAAVAGLVGTLTRRRVLPVVVCVLASVTGLLLYLNILFAGPEALARVVPTRSSLHHLWWLAGQGMDESARYSPPVPPQHGILLLTVAGIGITAVAADLLAVRLRRPAVAGLPLLVLFCVPLTTNSHRGAFGATAAFCLGMMGYLAMLAADGRDRLRVWGRLVTFWQAGPGEANTQREGPNTRELAASGRRIGLAAVVLALGVPLLLPGLREHKLFPGGQGIGPGSGGFVALPDPLAQMNSDLRRQNAATVMIARTGEIDPQYLQVYVLDTLTPTTWTLTPSPGVALRDGRLPAPPGESKNVPVITQRTRITLARGLSGSRPADNFLPLPYPAQTVSVAGNWLADQGTLTMFSTSASLSGLAYSVTSEEPAPTAQQLQQSQPPPAAIARADLTFPAIFRQLGALARQITRGQPSSYGKAVALQRWFTTQSRFSYSLSVGAPDSSAALIDFLTKTRRGYCQQFAFAMAVLARLVNIPSRVAIGYTPGTYLGNNRWQVKTSDAHAWPELYFQGAGWLRFEPTPAGATGQNTAFQPTYTLPLLPASPVSPASGPLPAAGSPQPGKSAAGPPGAHLRQVLGGGSATGGKRRHGSPVPVGMLAAAVLGLALIMPRSARSFTRRRRWMRAADDSRRAHAAWLELRDDLADHGIACPASESPRALAARISATMRLAPAENEALLRIAGAEERARYARQPAASGTLRSDVALVRRGVSRMSSRPARWYARLLPPSALAPARAALQHGLDVFGWMDMVTVRRRRHELQGSPDAPETIMGPITGTGRMADLGAITGTGPLASTGPTAGKGRVARAGSGRRAP